MAHVFESALSGRSRCRGCNLPIARGTLRFGEKLSNPFADGEMTLWFHPACAAWKRPEPVLEALAATPAEIPGRAELERAASASVAHRRRSRIDGAERAPSSQANCRHCHAPIQRGTWRIRLMFYDEGRFSPGGFVHLACRAAYFETADILDQVLHFSSKLEAPEREELTQAFLHPPE